MGILEGKRILVVGCADRRLHRVLGRQAGPGGGRHRGAHRVRQAEPGRADRQAAAGEGAGAGARRPEHRASRQPGHPRRRARRRPRRRGALDRLRAADRPRRQLPQHHVGGRRDGPARVHLLLQVAGGGLPAADEAGRRGRRPRLRRQQGLARLRLDGRGQGRPGVLQPLPRPRPGQARHPRQPGGRRPAAHDGGQVDPRLQGVRGQLAGEGPARLGPVRHRCPPPGRAWR